MVIVLKPQLLESWLGEKIRFLFFKSKFLALVVSNKKIEIGSETRRQIYKKPSPKALVIFKPILWFLEAWFVTNELSAQRYNEMSVELANLDGQTSSGVYVFWFWGLALQ